MTYKARYKQAEDELEMVKEAIEREVAAVLGDAFDDVLGVDVDLSQDMLMVHTMQPMETRALVEDLVFRAGFSRIHLTCSRARWFLQRCADGTYVESD